MPGPARQEAADFRQAVIRAAYHSPQQRRRRVVACGLLLAKYLLGGVVLIWPLGMLLVAAAHAAEPRTGFLLLLFALPGILAWCIIFLTGVRKDYDQLVRDQILGKGFMRRLR